MKTVHIDRAYVARYAPDLLERVMVANESRVDVWVSLGNSGHLVSQAVVGAIPPDQASSGGRFEWLQPTPFEVAWFDRASEVVTFEGDSSDPDRTRFRGKNVLLVDSHANTGATLFATTCAVLAAGADRVSSYVVALRTSSTCLPSWFSIVVGPSDRVLVPSDAADVDVDDHIANNRLDPRAIFRRLRAEDLSTQKFSSGRPALDRTAWPDYWYDLQTDDGRQVVLYEEAAGGVRRILGFVSYGLKAGGVAVVDEVAVDKEAQGRGIAGHLMRWVETHARADGCRTLELWSVDDPAARAWYGRLKYVESGRTVDLGPDGVFRHMSKPVIFGAPR